MPVTAAAGRSGVCGGVHTRARWRRARPHGAGGPESTSTRSRSRPTFAAGTFGPDLEAALGAVGDGYTLGHWPQSMDLSTVGGWLACRGAGQYSTRYGKIEDMVIGLEVVLADGRIVHTEGQGPRAATGPNLTQLFVGSEGTLGVITEARLRIHPLPAGPGAPRLRLQHVRRRDSRPAAGSFAAAPRRRSCASTTRPSRPATSSSPTPTCSSCSTRPIPPSWPPPWRSSTTSARAGPAPIPSTAIWCERWLGHRNDVSALAPLWRAGIVVDTVEVVGSVGRAARPLRGGDRRARGDRRDAGRVGSPVPRVYRRRLPLLHLRRAGPRRRRRMAGALLPRARGTPSPTPPSRTAPPSAITMASGLNRSRFLPRGPRHRGSTSWQGLKATFDPARHPQPGQIRPGLALRTARPGHERRRRRQHPRRRRRHVGRARRHRATRRHRRARAPLPAPARLARARAWSSSTPRGWPTPVLAVARAALARRGPGGRGRHRQPAGLEHRVGAGHRDGRVAPGIGWQDLRTVGTCLVLQAEGIRLAPNASATKVMAILDEVDPDSVEGRARASCASARSTAGWRGRSREVPRPAPMPSTSPTPPTPPSPPWSSRRPSVGTSPCCRSCGSRCR